MKALRARTFGGEGTGAREAIGFAASRLAKSLVNKINGWDADRDGKSGEGGATGGKGVGGNTAKPCILYVCAAGWIRSANNHPSTLY